MILRDKPLISDVVPSHARHKFFIFFITSGPFLPTLIIDATLSVPIAAVSYPQHTLPLSGHLLHPARSGIGTSIATISYSLHTPPALGRLLHPSLFGALYIIFFLWNAERFSRLTCLQYSTTPDGTTYSSSHKL
jgi:hypothetical protein